MRRVYKYPIPRSRSSFSIILPATWKFLRVSFQQENLFLWAEVDPEAVMREYSFSLYGTGHDIGPGRTYLTTYDDGPFVFHLYLANS